VTIISSIVLASSLSTRIAKIGAVSVNRNRNRNRDRESVCVFQGLKDLTIDMRLVG
jgi:hypothetical protein